MEDWDPKTHPFSRDVWTGGGPRSRTCGPHGSFFGSLGILGDNLPINTHVI